MTVGYVPGGFDLFHIGHLNILRASRARCDFLIAGVATDESLHSMKGHMPVVPFEERISIVSELRIVDAVIPDHSINKSLAWKTAHFDVLFKGTDWQNTAKGKKLEQTLDTVGAKVVYLPYTQRTSSTELRMFITARNSA